MKALITGINGFIASHLAEFLLEKSIEVSGTLKSTDETNNISQILRQVEIVKCDLLDKKKTEETVKKTKPDYIFHLAAQSFVMPSWESPEDTFKTNIEGTYLLLDAIKKSGADPVVCVASSSAAYGLTFSTELPIKETKEFRPSSPYAISKAATDMLAFLYWRAYKMKTLRLRFFNTVGPRKTGSAIAEWAQGIAEIEAGKRKKLGVGNLDGVVDVTDIRDSLDAVWKITKKGKIGEAYNICSGKGHKMEEVLGKMTSLSTKKIEVVKDPKKFRPLEDSVFIGDNGKIRSLGWRPSVPIEKTLEDTIDYWRQINKG